jgi:threonine dehydratase
VASEHRGLGLYPESMDVDRSTPTLGDVRVARERIAPFVHRTPVMTSRTLDSLVGSTVFLKCENLQRSGAFKARGAVNAVMQLTDEQAAHGVVAHSSGNHAGALALAASLRGIPSYLVMPRDAPKAKVDAVRGYGGEVIKCEPTLAAREEGLAAVQRDTGAYEVHPYDDPDVIAGAGTAALELLDEHPGIGLVIAPVSGGGLLSGTVIAAHGIDPTCTVWGAEPAGADDAARSLVAGHLLTNESTSTIADGLLAELSPRTFAILSEHLAGIVMVDDAAIVDAMRLLFGRAKLVVEPSGAAALAGLLALARPDTCRATASPPIPLPDQVGVILSGGNLDLDQLPF